MLHYSNGQRLWGRSGPGVALLPNSLAAEEFGELTELPGVIPAPYLARAQWIALEREDALPKAEIKRLLRQAYDLVFAKLTKKSRTELGGGEAL